MPLTICSVICSDFEGVLSVGGSVEGVACAGVKRLWLTPPFFYSNRQYVFSPLQFGGISCLLMGGISTLWYFLMGSRPQVVCSGGVPCSSAVCM